MKRGADIRDILLFSLGIWIIVLPPAWMIRFDIVAEKYLFLISIAITLYLLVMFIMGMGQMQGHSKKDE